MNTQSNTPARFNRAPLIAGIVLIAIGALTLAAQLGLFADFGMFFIPALGILFLAWGLLTRTFGLIIPGGILAGIGLGIALITGPLAAAGEPAQGAIFLLAFAAGWLLITLLSHFTDAAFQWWPLIPAGILGSIGGLLLAGETGLQVLTIIGYAWPVVLIAAGAWIILRKRS